MASQAATAFYAQELSFRLEELINALHAVLDAVIAQLLTELVLLARQRMDLAIIPVQNVLACSILLVGL
jgi:hypothetical protein